MALGVTNLKKGVVFVLEGTPYKVVDYSQKVMGRGGSIVNVRIKSLLDGRVFDRTFKGNESFDEANVQLKKVQYLYADGSYHFMDGESYEQFELNAEMVGDDAKFMKEGSDVQIMLFNGDPVSLELPTKVDLKVTYSEDVVRGDTSGSVQKPATLETGLELRVPAFIKTGNVIVVDTRDGAYVERKKD